MPERRRIPMVAGNWKMHLSPDDAVPLVRSMRSPLAQCRGVEIVLCPAAPALITVRDLVAAVGIRIGAQNCHFEAKGAYTGEISPQMLIGLCRYVIIGHSERRAMFGDDEALVRKKVGAVLRAKLRPILCVGEDLEEREAGRSSEVVARQLVSALEGMPVTSDNLVIAYEPVWAIGSGRACPPVEAARVAGLVCRGVLAELFGAEVASSVRVLYGGSVNHKNADQYFRQADVDGALVGGASLDAQAFIGIVRAAAQ